MESDGYRQRKIDFNGESEAVAIKYLMIYALAQIALAVVNTTVISN